jgi:hypothetical protein
MEYHQYLCWGSEITHKIVQTSSIDSFRKIRCLEQTDKLRGKYHIRWWPKTAHTASVLLEDPSKVQHFISELQKLQELLSISFAIA